MITLTASVVGIAAPVAALSVTTPWTTMATPFVNSVNAELSGVSCPADSGTECVAVGGMQVTGPAKELPLAETWKAGWIVTPTPTPGTGAAFTAISCGLQDYCMAVGNYSKGSFAELWDGVSWSSTMTTSSTARLSSVSCHEKKCLAVGSEGRAALAEYWSGQGWTQLAPDNPDPYDSLSGASCIANQCLAVGFTPSGALDELFKHSWTNVSPTGAARLESVSGVDCMRDTTPLSCMGIGASGSGCGCPLAELWNQSTGSWTDTGAFGSTDSQFNGVACPAASFCVAVGSQYGEFYPTDTLAEAWNGTRWTGMTTPPDKLILPFTSVSCSTATSCVTVGSRVVFGSGYREVQPEVAFWGTPP